MNRNEEIKRLRIEERWGLRKIGLFFGLSRQRIHQILGNTGHGFDDYRKNKAIVIDLDTSKTTDQMKEIAGRKTIHWLGARHYIKKGAAGIGYAGENFVSSLLEKNGIPHTLTNSRPVDIILKNGLKVEVKTRTKPHKNKYSENFYFFPVKRDVDKNIADYYIFLIGKDCFVVPSNVIPKHGSVGFVWPAPKNKTSIWTSYHNRFDLLK